MRIPKHLPKLRLDHQVKFIHHPPAQPNSLRHLIKRISDMVLQLKINIRNVEAVEVLVEF